MKTESKIMKINATENTFETESRNMEGLPLEEKLGGIGIGFNSLKRHMDKYPDMTKAFDEKSKMIMSKGCETETGMTGALRTCFTFISPEKANKKGNNGVFYSTGSSLISREMVNLDLDAIEIIGKAKKPSILVIKEDGAYFEDASDLAGKTTHEKIMRLAEKHEGAQYAVVGPAGENGVVFSSIALSTQDQITKGTDNMRFAGRGGGGAVLGYSKNILGIVVDGGKKPIKIAPEVKAMGLDLTLGSLSERTNKYRTKGTWFANIENQEKLRVGIYDNFSHGSDERAKALFKDAVLAQGYKIVDKGCPGCMGKCWKIIISPDGTVINKADYETFSLNGPNLGIYKLEDMGAIVKMADHLGMDAISIGTSIGYLLEQEKRFGDVGHVKDVVQAIAAGKHPLAKGLFQYAGNAPNAMHVKGVPFAAYLGNVNPARPFSLIDHMAHDSYNGWCYKDEKGSATNTIPEWIDNGVRGPQIMGLDIRGMCKFLKPDFQQEGYLIKLVRGINTTPDDLRTVAKLVNLRARMLDERLGFGPDDEVFPARCHEDFGFLVPHFNTLEFFNAVKKGVYEQLELMKKEYGLKA